MTTSVVVTAHCGDTTEVEVTLNDNVTGETIEEFTLQDSEEATRHVYDDHEIRIKEVEKQT